MFCILVCKHFDRSWNFQIFKHNVKTLIVILFVLIILNPSKIDHDLIKEFVFDGY